jgi:hypothetical protein
LSEQSMTRFAKNLFVLGEFVTFKTVVRSNMKHCRNDHTNRHTYHTRFILEGVGEASQMVCMYVFFFHEHYTGLTLTIYHFLLLINKYKPFTLYPQSGSKGISDIPPRRFTKIT